MICGKSTLKMAYPFWGGNRPSYCGLAGYELKCVDDFPVISIGSGLPLRVVEIDPSTSRLLLEHFGYDLRDSCLTHLGSINSYQNLFTYGMGTVDLYIYRCYYVNDPLPLMFGVRNNFTCGRDPYEEFIFGMEFLLQDYVDTLDSECGSPTQIPVNRMAVEKFADDVKMQAVELLKPSFEVYYVFNKTACSECEKSGGLCWQNTNIAEYTRCLYGPSGILLYLLMVHELER